MWRALFQFTILTHALRFLRVYVITLGMQLTGGKYYGMCVIVQELCVSRGGRPGLSVLTNLLASLDVKI